MGVKTKVVGPMDDHWGTGAANRKRFSIETVSVAGVCQLLTLAGNLKHASGYLQCLSGAVQECSPAKVGSSPGRGGRREAGSTDGAGEVQLSQGLNYY